MRNRTPNSAPSVAVITGGGSGIGRQTALELASRGWRIAVLGRRSAPLDETAALAAEAGAPGEAVLAIPTDVVDAAAVERAFRAVTDRFGRIDLLINNAGAPGPGGLPDEISLDDWQRTVEVNLTGSFLCAAAAFRAMRAQDPNGGRIINNGSIAARRPRPHSIAYSATKHAVTGLTRSLTLDGRPFGITACQIDIGNADTELLVGFAAGTGALQPDGSRRVEPTFDAAHAATMIADVADLPTTTAVHELVITAAGMPYDGRG